LRRKCFIAVGLPRKHENNNQKGEDSQKDSEKTKSYEFKEILKLEGGKRTFTTETACTLPTHRAYSDAPLTNRGQRR
jgi:hypothetical protein